MELKWNNNLNNLIKFFALKAMSSALKSPLTIATASTCSFTKQETLSSVIPPMATTGKEQIFSLALGSLE